MREFKVGDLVHTFYLYDSERAHQRVVLELTGVNGYKLQLAGIMQDRYKLGDRYNGCEFIIATPHMIIESQQFGIVEGYGINPGLVYTLGYQKLREERDELGLESFLRKYGC